MSNYGAEPFVSFKDFRWACGHVGPAVCKQCWDAKLVEIEKLQGTIRAAFEAGHDDDCLLCGVKDRLLSKALPTKITNTSEE